MRRAPARTTMVVGFDGTRRGRAAVTEAIRLASDAEEVEIVIVCTHERPPDFSRHPFTGKLIEPGTWPAEWAEKTARGMENEALRIRLAGFDSRSVCAYDNPDDLILKAAHEAGAQKIVVADDRVSFWYDLIFGSVTRRLLRISDIPVVVVPTAERLAA